jgi:hypothetical protein
MMWLVTAELKVPSGIRKMSIYFFMTFMAFHDFLPLPKAKLRHVAKDRPPSLSVLKFVFVVSVHVLCLIFFSL